MARMKTDYAAHDARYRQLRDAGAPGWDSAEDYRAREIELAWAFETLAAGHVLDLGCGAGNIAPWLVERGCSVTGIDISPTAIEWATARGVPNTRFRVGDVVAAIEGQYDLVIDGHCLHCIIGDDRARLLANVRAALAPKGSFFVATMCGEITLPPLRASFDPATRCQVVDGISYRYIGEPEAILEELRAAGFDVVRSKIDHRKSDDDQDNLWAIVTAR